MKKLIPLGVVTMILIMAASVQPTERIRRYSLRHEFKTGNLTTSELFELRKDQLRYNTMQRRAHRDGLITLYERRKLHRTKVHNRQEAFRFKHNRPRRVI